MRFSFAIAAACNALLIAAYLWSQGGQITHLRIDVRGDDITVSVDGRVRLDHRVVGPPLGGITIAAPNQDFQPRTLARETTIEHVRITTPDGRELFDAPSPDDSLLDTESGALAVDLAAVRWRDYSIDIAYRNTMTASVNVLVRGRDGVTIRLHRWSLESPPTVSIQPRLYSSGAFTPVSAPSEVDGSQSIMGAAAAVLRPYPYMLALVLLVTMIAAFAQRYPAIRTPIGSLPISATSHHAFVAAIALCAGVVTLYLLRIALGGTPNVADEAAYIFQARILASGRTHLATPSVPEGFQFSYTPFLLDHLGRWSSFYTPGHPLALVPGVMIGAPWLIPPLMATANVTLTYLLGLRVYGRWTATLAAAFVATSPLFLMQSSSYMSHTTSAASMLASIVSLISWDRKPSLSGALGGLFFGFLLLTRPFTAAILFLPFAALLLAPAIARHKRRLQVQRVCFFALAGGLMLLLYCAYNWNTTGNPLENGYQTSDGLGSALGFGGAHSLSNGLDNTLQNAVALLLTLNGWPAILGIGLVFVPFMFGTRNPYDWFFLLTSLVIVGSASLFHTTSMFNGPRYVYEALPFLMLLTAAGLSRLTQHPWAPAQETADPRHTSFSILHVIAATSAVALIGLSLSGWLFSRSSRVELLPIPPSAEYKANHGLFDDRLIREARRLDIENAVIVVRDCFGQTRNCYLSVFLENDLDLNGDIVWVFDQGEEVNRTLLSSYPCRSLYTADYDAGAIVAAGTTGGAC